MTSSLKGFSSLMAPFTKLSRSVAERGWNGTMTQLYTIGDIKFGELKGTDQWGNKYYEDVSQPFGQHRWIEYADKETLKKRLYTAILEGSEGFGFG